MKILSETVPHFYFLKSNHIIIQRKDLFLLNCFYLFGIKSAPVFICLFTSNINAETISMSSFRRTCSTNNIFLNLFTALKLC